MFRSNYISLWASADYFEGTSSIYSLTEAFIPTECYTGTAVRKQSQHSNSDASLPGSKDMFDGEDLGTNNVDASKPGTSTSISADINSCSEWSSSRQETLKMYSHHPLFVLPFTSIVPSALTRAHVQNMQRRDLEGRFSLSSLIQTTEFRY